MNSDEQPVKRKKYLRCIRLFRMYKTAKLPFILNSSICLLGIILCLINKDLLRIGVLLILVSFLGYAIIIAYCQLPPEDDYFLSVSGNDLRPEKTEESSEMKISDVGKKELRSEDRLAVYTALV